MDRNENALVELPSGGELKARGSNYELQISQTASMKLVRDTHFGKPNQRMKKPVLYKAGAEAIRIQYGVFDRYEIMNAIEDFENGFFFYRIRCSLVKLNPIDGKEYVVTEGYGSANTREANGGMANGFDLANTKLKIAEKRALVDAVIKLAGLSSAFTQDLDNDEFMQQAQTITSAGEDDNITAKQRNRLFAIAGEAGMTTEQARQWLKAHGVESTKTIKQKDYDALCEALEGERK